MDPNEISFNKDQFGNMFKKDSESERSIVSDRKEAQPNFNNNGNNSNNNPHQTQ